MGEQRPGREELAFLLPFFGMLLLLPPLVDLFVGKRLLLFGLPLETLYLFAVWILLIVGAMVLTWFPPFRDPPAGDDDEFPFEVGERPRAGQEARPGMDRAGASDIPFGPGKRTATDPRGLDGID